MRRGIGIAIFAAWAASASLHAQMGGRRGGIVSPFPPDAGPRTAPPRTITRSGMLRVAAADTLVLETNDHVVTTYQLRPATRIRRNNQDSDLASFTPGDRLRVESALDARGYFVAEDVSFQEAGTPALHRLAQQKWDLPSLPGIGADPLGERIFTESPSPTGIVNEEDPRIAKAKQATAAFAGQLPDFLCRQTTARYENSGGSSRLVDKVTADLTYARGAERYSNIAINGQRVDKDMAEIGGTVATGDFATILAALFSPAAAAAFHAEGTIVLRGRPADIFSYVVRRERSQLRVQVLSEVFYPEYGGKLWIDQQTGRVLRLERDTRNMPKSFPYARIQLSTEYDFIRLSGARNDASPPYLLPASTEIQSCQQSNRLCLRNRSEFHEYRKFGADSDLKFEEQQ